MSLSITRIYIFFIFNVFSTYLIDIQFLTFFLFVLKWTQSAYVSDIWFVYSVHELGNTLPFYLRKLPFWNLFSCIRNNKRIIREIMECELAWTILLWTESGRVRTKPWRYQDKRKWQNYAAPTILKLSIFLFKFIIHYQFFGLKYMIMAYRLFTFVLTHKISYNLVL